MFLHRWEDFSLSDIVAKNIFMIISVIYQVNPGALIMTLFLLSHFLHYIRNHEKTPRLGSGQYPDEIFGLVMVSIPSSV